jgi:hypothetical protein
VRFRNVVHRGSQMGDGVNGGGQLDEGFFRRYRELLDAEDAAFDELEHAYEEGERARFDVDLTEWRAVAEKRVAFLERHQFANASTPTG